MCWFDGGRQAHVYRFSCFAILESIFPYCYDWKLLNGITVLIFNAANDENVIGVNDCRCGTGLKFKCSFSAISFTFPHSPITPLRWWIIATMLIPKWNIFKSRSNTSDIQHMQRKWNMKRREERRGAERSGADKKVNERTNEINWNVRTMDWSAFKRCPKSFVKKSPLGSVTREIFD